MEPFPPQIPVHAHSTDYKDLLVKRYYDISTYSHITLIT